MGPSWVKILVPGGVDGEGVQGGRVHAHAVNLHRSKLEEALVREVLPCVAQGCEVFNDHLGCYVGNRGADEVGSVRGWRDGSKSSGSGERDLALFATVEGVSKYYEEAIETSSKVLSFDLRRGSESHLVGGRCRSCRRQTGVPDGK